MITTSFIQNVIAIWLPFDISNLIKTSNKLLPTMIYLINYLLHQSNQELGVVWLYCNYFHVKRQVCYYYVYYVINDNCHFDWNLISNLNKLIYNKLLPYEFQRKNSIGCYFLIIKNEAIESIILIGDLNYYVT